MTITVIGHLCLDVIRHSGRNETRSYGGIFFSVATLANLLGPNDTILPVFGVGKGDYDTLIERLSVYPNIDTEGIYKFNGPTNQVELVYNSLNERTECSRYISEPIPWKRIRQNISSTDMILVNMISGFDITLETLDEIRMETRAERTPVYLDVHSLTLGINDDFTRFRRPVDTWRRWLFMLHAIHLNEAEAAVLTPEKLDELPLAHQVLSMNTKVMHITRGERGCTLFQDSHKHMKRLDMPAVEPGKAVDPTGCGDVFAAAYCAHYAKSGDTVAATGYANGVAAFKAQYAGSMEIDKLSSFCLQDYQAIGGTS